MNAPESVDPITVDLIKRTAAYVPDFEPDGTEDTPTAQKPWHKWLAAELGFRNHWYPTEASRNIRDGEHKVVKLLGEDIMYLRRAGRLYAIEDRCSHRGTRFSYRPVHYTNTTITCWHHAYTFNLDDGRIRCLLNTPGSELCGRKGIKTYPVREEKGSSSHLSVTSNRLPWKPMCRLGFSMTMLPYVWPILTSCTPIGG